MTSARSTPARDGRAWIVLTVAATLLVAVPVTQAASCSVHELAHAAIGSALGWEVEHVDLCLGWFDNGSVTYASSTGGIADDVESWAGGLVAAALLLTVYVVGLVRTRAPTRSVAWWTVGLVIAGFAGLQVFIGVLEGIVPVGVSYGDRFYGETPGLWVPLTVGAGLLGPAVHAWYWRRRTE